MWVCRTHEHPYPQPHTQGQAPLLFLIHIASVHYRPLLQSSTVLLLSLAWEKGQLFFSGVSFLPASVWDIE